MLNLIHESHFGIVKCKQRARTLLYWPNMCSDIETMIKSCTVCLSMLPAQQKEELLPYPNAKRPWERISSDFMEFGGQDYLVVVDAYSNWIEVHRARDKSSKTVIAVLKMLFSQFGIPDIHVSDNVPFNSKEFRDFASGLDMQLVFTSPRYPQSNGRAEKAVAIVKGFLRKGVQSGRELSEFLLDYRASPLNHINLSPASLFLNRNLKTKLPVHYCNLEPKVNLNVEAKFNKRSTDQKRYFDESAKTLPPLAPGDNVLIWNFDKTCWDQGVVVDLGSGPRSYLVRRFQDPPSTCLVRNSKFLRRRCAVNEPLGIEEEEVVTEGDSSGNVLVEPNAEVVEEGTDRSDSAMGDRVGSQEAVVGRTKRHTRPPVHLQNYILT
ncbi:hypothetical protein GE061_008786 [Apolygus lucorum]|uniref:RNA-directed DNA polymerase n=1 Tax=Apolygus lucorum TaxID=248454 RepID=A0A8S9WNL8_APOLU|nr:hypothetical protein GE061_008786 [Apolygus lucorum]